VPKLSRGSYAIWSVLSMSFSDLIRWNLLKGASRISHDLCGIVIITPGHFAKEGCLHRPLRYDFGARICSSIPCCCGEQFHADAQWRLGGFLTHVCFVDEKLVKVAWNIVQGVVRVLAG